MKNSEFKLVEYRSDYGLAVVKMWRQAFQRAMGLEEHNRFGQVNGQLDFLASIDRSTIRIAITPASSTIVGFLVLSDGCLDQLYVHVDWQGMGIGSQLLDEAKARSPDGIELFAFQKNKLAQAFYLSRGFREIGRGYASFQGNPWATSTEQLADIRYRWDP